MSLAVADSAFASKYGGAREEHLADALPIALRHAKVARHAADKVAPKLPEFFLLSIVSRPLDRIRSRRQTRTVKFFSPGILVARCYASDEVMPPLINNAFMVACILC